MAKVAPTTKSMRKRRSTTTVLSPVTRTKNAKVTKPAASAPREKRVSTDRIFGHHLPSARLRLPSEGNVSALEQIVFLTETIRSRDPLNRLVQNGFDTTTLEYIINQHRTFPKYPLKSNSLGALLRNTMREWHAEWTFKEQKSGAYQKQKPSGASLSLENMQLNCQDLSTKYGNGEGVIENVSFEALAVDVTRLPDGDDALDLTRCVLWCLHHPQSGLLYPRDFTWLTQQLGGPQPIQQNNYDHQVFVRWRGADKANKKALTTAKEKHHSSGEDLKEAETPAAQLAAETAHTIATAVLAAIRTPRSALVTVEDGQQVVHQYLIPDQPHPGPSTATVAQYLAHLHHQPSVHLPSGTQVSHYLSAESRSGPEPTVTVPEDFETFRGAYLSKPSIDEVANSHNLLNPTDRRPANMLQIGELFQESLPSIDRHVEDFSFLDAFTSSGILLDPSDYAMAEAEIYLARW